MQKAPLGAGLFIAWLTLLLLAEILRHLEMMLQRGQGLAGPILQVRIVAALGVPLEQRHRILVRACLHRVKLRAAVLAALALELVELALVRAVERRRQLGLDFAAGDEPLQLGAGLGVIAHHLRGERLFVRIALGLRELGGLDLEHIRDRHFPDEIDGGGADAERRIDAGRLAGRLRKRGAGEQHASEHDDTAFHDGLPQLAALRLTPLRSATVLSFVLAAFSSFRLVLRTRTMSSWPSSSAHAISVP